jgi:hypothetical protein
MDDNGPQSLNSLNRALKPPTKKVGGIDDFFIQQRHTWDFFATHLRDLTKKQNHLY